MPKFGEWDENNPSAGDGFTGFFNQLVTERQSGSARVPYLIDDSVYMNSNDHGSNRNKPTVSVLSIPIMSTGKCSGIHQLS